MKEVGRIVLDRKTFQEEYYQEPVVIHPHRGNESTPLNDVIELAFFPPHFYGYSLARKDWCKFYIDNIREVEWNPKSFDSLVIGDGQKHVLRALVSSHPFPEDARDQTQQKGKGMFYLSV